MFKPRRGILEQDKCPWWICWTFDNPFRRLIHNPHTILEGLVGEGMMAMDHGCGMGYFTIEMARMVGPTGKVYAVDLQKEMFPKLRWRAEKAGVADRIETIVSTPENLTATEKVDFILLFWMMHEVPDKDRLYKELRALLNPGGKLLLVEPYWHVSEASFLESAGFAECAGFKRQGPRKVAFSRAIVFE